MGVVLGPVAIDRHESIEHPARTAAIEMRVGRRSRADGLEVQAAAAGNAVIGDFHLVIIRQAIDIGGALRRGGDIMEFPATPKFFETRDHGQHRRNADPATDHHGVAGILHHRKIVFRFRDVEDLADLPFFMDVARSAATVDRMMDGDFIIAANGGIIDQRIAARQAGGKLHVDMCAGIEGRHQPAIDRFEDVAVDAFGFPADILQSCAHHPLRPVRCVSWQGRGAMDRRTGQTAMRVVTSVILV